MVVNLVLNIKAGEAKPGLPLAPILGQYQVNTSLFCKDFNSVSGSYELGVVLRVKLQILKKGNYKYIIIGPNFYELFYLIFEEEEDGNIILDKTEFFDLICIYSFFFNKTEEESAKILLAYLATFDYNIDIV